MLNTIDFMGAFLLDAQCTYNISWNLQVRFVKYNNQFLI